MKKMYLRNYKNICDKIKSLKRQEEAIRAEMDGAKAIEYSDMPRSNKQLDLSDYIIKLEQVEEKIKTARIDKLLAKADIEESISKLDSAIESDILRMRYIECWGWDDIGHSIGCSRATINRLHGNALKNFKII